MPNLCDYEMVVRGYKDNVDEFVRIIQADYNYTTNTFSHDRHLFRVFEADVISEEKTIGVEKYVTIAGYCAWSVYSCMLPGPFTYYTDSRPDVFKEHFFSEALIRGTNILLESKRLHLDIEIYSSESGMSFQEYYLISNGNYIKNEEHPFDEYYIGDVIDGDVPIDEFCDDYGLEKPLVEDLVSKNEYWYSPNRLDWDFHIDCKSKPLIRNNMIKIIR